jgi:CxxC motif-containing protein (DUF1111 family)
LGSNKGPSFGDPFPGLTSDLKARFTAGKAGFEEVETVADGVGPVFNDVSCVACHASPATGGSSNTIETRFGRMVNGQFDPMTN